MCQRWSAWGDCDLVNHDSSKFFWTPERQKFYLQSASKRSMYFRLYHQIYASGFYESWLHIRHLPTRALMNHCKFTSFPDLLFSEMLRHLQFETHSTPQQKSETDSGDSIYVRDEQNQKQKPVRLRKKGRPPLKPSRATKAKIVKFPFFSIVSPISCVFVPAIFSRMTTNGDIGPTMSSTLSGKMKATVVEGPDSPIGLTNIQKLRKLFAINLQFHKLQPCPQPFSRRLATASVQQDTPQ